MSTVRQFALHCLEVSLEIANRLQRLGKWRVCAIKRAPVGVKLCRGKRRLVLTSGSSASDLQAFCNWFVFSLHAELEAFSQHQIYGKSSGLVSAPIFAILRPPTRPKMRQLFRRASVSSVLASVLLSGLFANLATFFLGKYFIDQQRVEDQRAQNRTYVADQMRNPNGPLDVSEMDLQRLRFIGVHVPFMEANQADLRDSRMDSACFGHFAGTKVRGDRVRFSRIEALGFRLPQSQLPGAIFDGARLGAPTPSVDEGTKVRRPRCPTFRQVDVEADQLGTPPEVLFVSANLTGATFVGASLAKADFSSAQLGQADFTDARFDGVDFTRANLEGAVFSGALLNDDHTGCIFGHPIGYEKSQCIEGEEP
jgi:uncharacterized protein YjbI with pentapeptide repeats